jgi:uncharacterized protein involved in exopolysaccharide biosynthesis
MTEKEEVQLRVGLMHERMGRLQAEFTIAQNLLAALQQQLAEIEKKSAEDIEHGQSPN